MFEGSLCYKHVETWRDVYHSSDISQKASPWQISVVMSAIAICWPKSWQNFNKRSAQVQKLSLRIQWEDGYLHKNFLNPASNFILDV